MGGPRELPPAGDGLDDNARERPGTLRRHGGTDPVFHTNDGSNPPTPMYRRSKPGARHTA